jgi:hypothetical protein
MPELRVTLNFEIDGESLANMPIVRRYIVGEVASQLAIIATPDNNSTTYHPLAAAIMPILGAICITNDQPVNLNINQNTPLALNANGLLLILGADLAQGTPSQNVEYNNPAVSTPNVNLDIPVIAGT